MGNRTVVHIYNDGFSDVEGDAEAFVERMINASVRGGEIAAGNHANVAKVMPSTHDSMFSTFIAKDGSFLEVSKFNDEIKQWVQDARLRNILKGWIATSLDRISEVETMIEEAEEIAVA